MQILGSLKRGIRAAMFRSDGYWENRYLRGGTSGSGSAGRLARFKAEILNGFVRDHVVTSVVEFGCGDGRQLELADYPKYFGLDVSAKAIDLCRGRFAEDPAKRFEVIGCDPGRHDLALSVDVIFHLIEDRVFEAHMRDLFDAAERFVVIYSSNTVEPHQAVHIRHRVFTDWVERNRPDWALFQRVANAYPYDPNNEDESSFSDFYFYSRPAEPRMLARNVASSYAASLPLPTAWLA